MSAQHTPGPWDVGSKQSHGTEVKGAKGVGVAWCGCNAFYGSGGSHVITADEAYANACLIAASQVMYDALGTIAAGNTDPDRMVEIAAAALYLARFGAALNEESA